ncbi:MAG: peptidase P60 [Rhizobiales bacterium 65-9]|nr:C40 family peptidase [Hyphomicrobiales bacterium]OJY37849.1 MAG: peptidase P60 [Rhizobiales bacterium 65-9]
MNSVSRADIAAETRRWVGTPYAHQASVRQVGCDCLGLLRGVWRALRGAEPERAPPYAPDWSIASREETLLIAARQYLVPAPSAPRCGDVLFFRWREGLPAAHVAILVSDETFAHAHDGAEVAEVFYGPWWRRRLAAAFSFPGMID